jgi:hypothetical protein
MAASLQQIRTLTIEARERGIAEVKAKLDALSAAQVQVGETSETSARKQASAANAFKAIENAAEGETKAMRVLAKELSILDRARAQGVGGDDVRQNELRTKVWEKYTFAVAQAKKQEAIRSSVANDLNGVAGAAQLTSNQLLNLSRQGNDVITMFAMGASPMQVFASQAGQVYDALESGPNGLRGSLRAIGDGLTTAATTALGFVTPMGLVATGLTAAAAAAIYFGDNTEKNVKRAEDAAKSYDETLKRIRSTQGDIAKAAGSIFDERRLQGGSTTAAQVELEVLRQQAARKGLVENLIQTPLTAGSAMNPISDARELLRQITGDTSKGGLAQLAAQLDAGTLKASQLEETLIKLRVNPDLPSDLGNVVDEMIKGATAAADVEARIKAIRGAAARLRVETTRGNFSSASDNLRELVPAERLTAREDVERRYQQAMASARLLPEAMGAMASADANRQKALDEIDRQESVIRQGRELDLRAIGARTVAEQALIAAERERLALSGENLDQSEKAARIAQQAAMIIAQANKAAEDTLRSSRQQNAAAGLQGYQAGAQAIIDRYALEIKQAEGAEGAVLDLTKARNLDLQTLQIQTQRSLFQPQQDQLASLTAEAAAIGASDDVRRRLIDGLKVENDIRQAGISATGEQADAYRRNAEALSVYEDRVRRAGDAWDDVKQAGESAIDGLVGSITSGDFSGALKSIADDVAKTALELAVANPLKNALLGTSYGTMGDLFNGPGAAPELGMPSVQSTAAMNVTAAIVNIGGVGVGGAGGAIERLLNPANGNALGGVASADLGKNGLVPVSEVAAYIQQAAAARGIDPGIALRVAKSEGLGEGIWQSNYSKNGYREPSFGPFQLLKGGAGTGFGQGMGNDFMRQTGLDPADPRNTFAGIDFALDGAAKNGWGAWYGAGKAGIGNRDGLAGAQAIGVNTAATMLQDAAPKLAESATALTTGLGQSTGLINTGIGQIANQFVPGFGGILTQLLDGMSQKAGGGGFGGLLGGFLGGGGGISAGATSTIMGGAQGLFSGGGYTGPGGRHQPAGVVHRGEVVWSQDDVARAGGVGAVEGMRLGLRGYAGGGYAPPAGVAMPSYARMQAPANAPAPQISQTFVNAPPVVSQTDEPDGRGGRRQVIVFQEMMAANMKPGSKPRRELEKSGLPRPPAVYG